MGAWDIGSFDNDGACDWLCDLERSSDTSLISAALCAVTNIGDEYLEAPDCCNALAAAEIVAAIRGHPLSNLPSEAKQWVDAHRSLDASGLVAAALAAIQRIRTNSELKELWDEVDETSRWLVTVDDLTTRLNAQ